MKGHQHVIDMRMDRIKPGLVCLYVDQDPGPGWDENPYPHYYCPHPEVWVAEGESFARLDLRFMVGLTVSINALSIPRMAEAMWSCKAARAAHVLAFVYDPHAKRVTLMQEYKKDE